MAEAARPSPFFLAEDLALDFLNTSAAPWGHEIEWIGDGPDLLAWLELAGLVHGPVVTRFWEAAKQGELDAVAARARELREWFRAYVGDHAGRALSPVALDDLGVINSLLALDHGYGQIEASHSSRPGRIAAKSAPLRWRRDRHWDSSDALLLPLAEAIGDLVCGVDFKLVKMCEGPTCTMWFHDVSQNHTRRWCSMAVCGNRAKVAAYRARKRQAR